MLDDPAGDELCKNVKIDAEQKCTHPFRSKLHLQVHRFTCQKEHRRRDQPDRVVKSERNPWMRDENAKAVPRKQEHSASDESKKMLSNSNRAKVSEHSQQQIYEAGINKVPPRGMTKRSAREFS